MKMVFDESDSMIGHLIDRHKAMSAIINRQWLQDKLVFLMNGYVPSLTEVQETLKLIGLSL